MHSPRYSLKPMTPLAVVLALLFCWTAWGEQGHPAGATPVREADAVCAKCHAEIYQHYLGTPMANGSGAALEHLIPGAVTEAASGMHYAISESDGEGWLSYERAGDSAVRGKQELLYYLGSGNLGVTYLYSINGYLLESPVAYYSKLKIYDMAPGRGGVTRMPGAMPMNARCMRCHMSGVQRPEAGTQNRFTGAPFLEGGITCEACHGETRRHVATGGRAAVINPAKLDPVARDSVCYRCHLEGDTSVEHKGRTVFDYKPGDRIGEDVSYFVLKSGSTARSVSEIEELNVSQCKRASGDRMSCMSCHDPHSRPTAAERAAYYRSRCLACHTQPMFATAHYPGTPDCTSCHMPKTKAEDTPHVAWTDHRILKQPQLLSFVPLDAGAAELKPVLENAPVTPRDVALAYYGLVMKGHREFVEKATALLSAVRKSDAGDEPVLAALGSLEQMQGRAEAAEALYGEALRLDPLDMEAANNMAMLLTRAGKVKEGQALWKQAFEVNEDVEGLGINLAISDCMLGDTAGSRAVLERVLIYSPDSKMARTQLEKLAADPKACAGPKTVARAAAGPF
jgi:tetratricopeptide (TPR) repeat protein